MLLSTWSIHNNESHPAVPNGVRVAGRFNLKSETGALGTPDLAPAEKGESLLTAVVDEVAALVQQMSDWPERDVLGPIDPAS